jgi:uncharacterized membrane protein
VAEDEASDRPPTLLESCAPGCGVVLFVAAGVVVALGLASWEFVLVWSGVERAVAPFVIAAVLAVGGVCVLLLAKGRRSRRDIPGYEGFGVLLFVLAIPPLLYGLTSLNLALFYGDVKVVVAPFVAAFTLAAGGIWFLRQVHKSRR